MKIPNEQENLIKTGLRLPRHIYEEVQAAATHNGRSMNAEIIARLELVAFDVRLQRLACDSADMKKMLRELLER